MPLGRARSVASPSGAGVCHAGHQLDLLPLRVPDGPRPTISLSASSGYAAQEITVSGQGVAGYPGVRLAWALDDTTLTLADDGRYQATIVVPSHLPAGPAKVCAAVSDAAAASFACADFTVTDPPPVQISGSIPLSAGPTAASAAPAAVNAEFRLLNAAGATVASVPIDANGHFTMLGVRPGTYRYAVTGAVPVALASGVYEAMSGSNHLKLQTTVGSIERCTAVTIVATAAMPISADPSRLEFEPAIVGGGGLDKQIAFTPLDVHFGTYVSGVDLPVTFGTVPQTLTGQTVTAVEFSIDPPGPAPEIVIGTDTTAPYQVVYNVKNLPPGRSTIYARPIIPGAACPAIGARAIDVIADPMQSPVIQPGTGQTRWNAAKSRYDFSGVIPTVKSGNTQLLPAEFDTPNLPCLGVLHNRLSAGIRVDGSMELDGTARIRMIALTAEARVLDQTILPPGTGFDFSPNGIEHTTFPSQDLRTTSIDLGRQTLGDEFYKEFPVYNGPVATFFGIISDPPMCASPLADR